jgi:hypothetical protein
MSGSRPETGGMKFGDDWTGVFIRGDNAGYYAMELSFLLRDLEKNSDGEDVGNLIRIQILKGLAKTLGEAMEPHQDHLQEFIDSGRIQWLKDWEECQKD